MECLTDVQGRVTLIRKHAEELEKIVQERILAESQAYRCYQAFLRLQGLGNCTTNVNRKNANADLIGQMYRLARIYGWRKPDGDLTETI